MHIIQGKQVLSIDKTMLANRLAAYHTVHIDLGTGDGRYVRHMAQTHPGTFVIGVDACRENLRESSRRAPANALYIIANALALPVELYGLASRVTINFPWGSLLEGLLAEDAALLDGLAQILGAGAALDIRLNAGALQEAGWSLEAGAARVRGVLASSGFAVRPATTLTAHELKLLPTTWAKRLAYGRDPRAVYLAAAPTAVLYQLMEAGQRAS